MPAEPGLASAEAIFADFEEFCRRGPGWPSPPSCAGWGCATGSYGSAQATRALSMVARRAARCGKPLRPGCKDEEGAVMLAKTRHRPHSVAAHGA